MQLEKIISEILDESKNDFVIHRMLNNSLAMKTVINRLNEIIASKPEYTDVVVGLLLYPAIKWTLGGEDIITQMNNICSPSEEIQKLEAVQQIIEDATGNKPRLLLENRQKYFSDCKNFVSMIEKSIELVSGFPDLGPVYREVLNVFTAPPPNREKNPPKDTYIINNINKHIKTIIAILYEVAGEDYERALDSVLSGNPPAEGENQFIHHNIHLLLIEYLKILWYSKYSSDKSVRLLSCSSEDEMLEIAKKDEVYYQAYLIAEYVKLVDAAIEQVKAFPYEGKEYHMIIRCIIDNKFKGVTDAGIAKILNMSTCNYAIKKKRALRILSAVLWGCNADTFTVLLTRQK